MPDAKDVVTGGKQFICPECGAPSFVEQPVSGDWQSIQEVKLSMGCGHSITITDPDEELPGFLEYAGHSIPTNESPLICTDCDWWMDRKILKMSDEISAVSKSLYAAAKARDRCCIDSANATESFK